MGFFNHLFSSIGKKIKEGARFIGQKVATGLDYGIQGLKIATDFADKYTLGLDHFIPYYSFFKSGIDVSDHIRKMIKGEEKFGASTALDMGLDVLSGALSLHGGKAELEGLKGGFKMFRGARATGSGVKEALKIGAGRAIRGYGLHPQQLKQMGQEGVRGAVNIAKAVRKGDPIAIAKVAGATAGTVGLVDLKKKANEEENQRRNIPQPKPRVLQTKQEPIKQAPSIVPKPIQQPTQPKNLVYKDTGIYQNGRLVG